MSWAAASLQTRFDIIEKVLVQSTESTPRSLARHDNESAAERFSIPEPVAYPNRKVSEDGSGCHRVP